MIPNSESKHNICGKSMDYNAALKKSSIDETKIDTRINMKLNETYNSLVNKSHLQGKSNNFNKYVYNYYIKKGIIWFCLGCFIIFFLMLLNSLVITKQSYENIEIQYMVDINDDIDINNNHEAKLKYSVFMDTLDIYIDQPHYKNSLRKTSNPFEKNTAFTSNQVSKM